MLRKLALGLLLLTTNTLFAHNFDALVYMPAGPNALNSTALAEIVTLGNLHNFIVDSTSRPTMISPTDLADYDVVIFLNRTPADLGSAEQGALQAFLQAGNGMVVIHAALDSLGGWGWWEEAVDAFVDQKLSVQPAEVIVADQVHPSTLTLPQLWAVSDAWYNLSSNPRGKAHVLATLRENSITGGTNGFDHPLSWCKEYGGGRVWVTTLGGTQALYMNSFFRDHLTGGIEWAAGALPGDAGATLDDNYDIVTLDPNNTDPMALDIAKDGRVFFVEKGGGVKIWKPSTSATVQAGSVPIFPGGENGLMGMALAPGFPNPPYIYLHYTQQDGNWANTGPGEQRLSRFVINGDQMDLASEEILLSYTIDRAAGIHSSGALTFDGEGNLLVATGDNTSYGLGISKNPFATIDERPGNEIYDAQRTSGNTDDLRGKILRIRPSDSLGNGYTLPAGNLFPATDSTRGEIYVMGVRNPFRIRVDTATQWLYWGDVGPDAVIDDPMRGPIGKDEFNQAKGPGNFGWPYFGGPNEAYVDYDFTTGTSGQLFDPNNPTNDSPNNTGKASLPPAQPALMWMDKNRITPEFPEFGDGSATAMAGDVYHFTPDSTSPGRLPAYFDKTLFIMDWTRNWIREVKLNGNGEVMKINPFLESYDWRRPMDLKVGPDGCLYVLEWDLQWGGASNPDSRISRICYAPGARSPQAVALADQAAGPVPLQVQFDASTSTDPGGDSLRYLWDFGDGSPADTTAQPLHTYTATGVYTVSLTVTNDEGRLGQATLSITAGNSPPEVSLVRPLEGSFFEWLDSIRFEVEVTDPEDGSTLNGSIDCAQLTNQTLLGHGGHAHPSVIFNTCEGLFDTSPAGHETEEDELLYLFEANYIDQGLNGSGRLRGSDIHLLHPRRKQAEHFTFSQGVSLVPTDDSLSISDVADIDHGDYIAYEPMNLDGVRSVRLRYASGGAGGQVEIHKGQPDGLRTRVGQASLLPTGSWWRYREAIVPVVDPGGTDTYYFVFSNANQPNDLFRLNWLYFGEDSVTLNPLELERESQRPWLQVFPNPTSGPIQLMVSGERQAIQASLLDLQGHEVATASYPEAARQASPLIFDPGKLSPGLYLLQIEMGEYRQYRKIIFK
jgi:cytochrome c